ncbi:Tyrosyl-DNA phosphodiesterase 1 [Linum grandiflorum]
MSDRDLVSWNTIISGYAQNGVARVALELVSKMVEDGQRPDSITVVSVLPAAADFGSLKIGKSIHGYAIRAGFDGLVNVSTAFVDMYSKCKDVVRLISYVPGYHTGSNMKKWGHMKLKAILQECVFDKEFKSSLLVYQFSSLGSLDEKWMTELATSMSSGVSDDKKPLGLGVPRIIWPTVEDVRCSLEGYAAGNAVPSPLKNVEKEVLKKYWAKWKATHTGRCWFLLTSSNLSKAAWGALQKNNSQLMIRSYELGVLFLPSQGKQQNVRSFSCTSNSIPSSQGRSSPRTELVTLKWDKWQLTEDMPSSQVIRLPVPYELPPQPYAREDVPWSWDRKCSKEDVYGQVWPRSE